MKKNRKVQAREFCRKALSEEFNSAKVARAGGNEEIIPAKKCRTGSVDCNSILKLCDDFRALDEHSRLLPAPEALDENLRRCKLCCQTSLEPREEARRECTCPIVALRSVRKCAVRLAYCRSELDLRPASDFRICRQAKRGRLAKKRRR